ncbi:MAG: hypothetical protein ACXACB_03340 [Promethearchaeota archaeon]|jgi:hypothetical protein
MGKFDFFDDNLYTDEIANSSFFNWTINAFQGKKSKKWLKDKTEKLFFQHNMMLKIRDPERLVFEHPQIDASVEISFEGTYTSNGTRYVLRFHSESFEHKIEDARNQKKFYREVFYVILPATWRKESYYEENGKRNYIHRPRRRLRRKKRKKKWR